MLALAFKPTSSQHRELRFEDVASGLTLLGMFGLADPPRGEAVDAVRRCRDAGIRVKMITGDHAGTAKAIARSVGLANPDSVKTGRDLDQLDDGALVEIAAEADVYAEPARSTSCGWCRRCRQAV